MTTARNRRRLTWLGLVLAASAPYAAILGTHLYARTQPRTCEDRRDVIIGGNRPASFGTVTTCYAWGWWQISQSLRRDDE